MPQNPIDSYNSYITSINLAWIFSLAFMNQDMNQDRRSQTYILLLSIRVFSSGVISLVLKMILSHSSRLFFLYSGSVTSVFTLLCAHNRYLKKRKFMLLACWTAKNAQFRPGMIFRTYISC